MKIEVYSDEMYPVWFAKGSNEMWEPDGVHIEVPDFIVEEWKTVHERFRQLNRMIGEYVKEKQNAR